MPTPRSAPDRCRRRFLRFFPGGFADETYIDWERDYKWKAHQRWKTELGKDEFTSLLEAEEFAEIARRAVTIESRHDTRDLYPEDMIDIQGFIWVQGSDEYD